MIKSNKNKDPIFSFNFQLPTFNLKLPNLPTPHRSPKAVPKKKKVKHKEFEVSSLLPSMSVLPPLPDGMLPFGWIPPVDWDMEVERVEEMIIGLKEGEFKTAFPYNTRPGEDMKRVVEELWGKEKYRIIDVRIKISKTIITLERRYYEADETLVFTFYRSNIFPKQIIWWRGGELWETDDRGLWTLEWIISGPRVDRTSLKSGFFERDWKEDKFNTFLRDIRNTKEKRLRSCSKLLKLGILKKVTSTWRDLLRKGGWQEKAWIESVEGFGVCREIIRDGAETLGETLGRFIDLEFWWGWKSIKVHSPRILISLKDSKNDIHAFIVLWSYPEWNWELWNYEGDLWKKGNTWEEMKNSLKELWENDYTILSK